MRVPLAAIAALVALTHADAASAQQLSVADAAAAESSSAGASFVFTLSPAAAAVVTVRYASAPGTALREVDYGHKAGNLTFQPGQTSKVVKLFPVADTLDEPSETFTVGLSNASGATILRGTAVGTITDDDPAPALSISDASIVERDTGSIVAPFTVSLSAASGQVVTVRYGTAARTATAGVDYVHKAGQLTFQPGQTSKTFNVSVVGDLVPEPDEAYDVNLWNPTAATLADAQGTGTIDDGPRTPNVLFIAVDDLNDWVSILGGYPGTVHTPNFDRLAARGLTFTAAHVAAPACLPSRISLLTSIRPSTSGLYINDQPAWRPLLPDAVTLPQHFRQQGYHTLGAGTIFHGPSYNDAASWDEYLERPADPLPAGRPLNGLPGTGHFDWGPVDVPEAAMADAKVAQWAIDFLAQPSDRSFFLAVGLGKPHLPFYLPPAYFALYPLDQVVLPTVVDDDLADLGPIANDWALSDADHARVTSSGNHAKAVQGYLAGISFADAQLGKLLDALDASPHSADTMVVLWGDNGFHLGEKRHWRKFALWEESTRVPLVFVVPGTTSGGSRSDRLVSLLDVYPTIVAAAGVAPALALEGVSFATLLGDPTAAWDRPSVITYGPHNHAVRRGTWRYITYVDGAEELYDRAADPHEWTNLAADPAYASVKAMLRTYLPTVNTPGPQPSP